MAVASSRPVAVWFIVGIVLGGAAGCLLGYYVLAAPVQPVTGTVTETVTEAPTVTVITNVPGPSSVTQTAAFKYIPFSEIVHPTVNFNATSSQPTYLTVQGNATSDAPGLLVWHQCSSYEFNLKFKASTNVSYVLVKGLILNLTIGGNVSHISSNATLKVEAEASGEKKITVYTCRDLPKFNEKHCVEVRFGLEVELEVHHDSVTEESNPTFTLNVAGKLCGEKTGNVHLAEYNLCLKYRDIVGCGEINQHHPHAEDVSDEPVDGLPEPDLNHGPETPLTVVGWSRNGASQTVTLENAGNVNMVAAYAVSTQDNGFALVQVHPSPIFIPGQKPQYEMSFQYPDGSPTGLIAFYQTTAEQ
jgi:hypothetical protein